MIGMVLFGGGDYVILPRRCDGCATVNTLELDDAVHFGEGLLRCCGIFDTLYRRCRLVAEC